MCDHNHNREDSSTSSHSSDSNEYNENSVDEDDEETLEEEEFLDINGNSSSHGDEIQQLQNEAALSVEDLLKKYYGTNCVSRHDESDEVKALTSHSCNGELKMKLNADFNADNMIGKVLSNAVDSTVESYFGDLLCQFSDDDIDYKPPEFWKKEVRIGSQFQVDDLPEVGEESSDDSHESEVLWIPIIRDDTCLEKEITSFLVDCRSSNLLGSHCSDPSTARFLPVPNKPSISTRMDLIPDDDTALFALFQSNYDFDLAKSKLQSNKFRTETHPSGPKTTFSPGDSQNWTVGDCELLEDGLLKYNKNFWAIKQEFLMDRTVGEIICFYYYWKKPERFNRFFSKQKEILLASEEREDRLTRDLLDPNVEKWNQMERLHEGPSTSSAASYVIRPKE